MANRLTRLSVPASPLERFIREYVEARDGVWEEIEPRVYDVLLGPEMTRLTFDPEALPEHPQAQLASLGSPLFDRLLGDAAGRWSSARLYRAGVNVRPHDLGSRLRRSISLPPGVTIQESEVRALNFPQAVFWFKASFASDQKEEEVLPVGIDLHHLREVRHLDALLTPNRLSEEPELSLAEAPHAGLVAGYRAARVAMARTAVALANARRRAWSGRVEKQISRMSAYYAQLRREAQSQVGRGRDPIESAERDAARRNAIDQEERLRITELRRKSALRVSAKLISVLVVQQPKLLIAAVIAQKGRTVGRLDIVWDSITESIEPVVCPGCGQSTFALEVGRAGLRCAGCSRGVAQNVRHCSA